MKDQAIVDFIEFVNNLDKPVVKLEVRIVRENQLKKWPQEPFHTINLKMFIKDINNYQKFVDWWASKNMTPHLRNIIVKTILNINPPESVRNTLLLMML